MKIGLSFVTLTGAAVLAVGASAAQARIGQSQALAGQMRAVKTAALWYPAGAPYFNKQYQTLTKQFQIRHQTTHRSLPSNMRGQDQLSTPGWSGELPF
jgi:hypothetical protein